MAQGARTVSCGFLDYLVKSAKNLGWCRNRKPEPPEPFFVNQETKSVPKPSEPFFRNRIRNRASPWICAETQRNLFIQRNCQNRKPGTARTVPCANRNQNEPVDTVTFASNTSTLPSSPPTSHVLKKKTYLSFGLFPGKECQITYAVWGGLQGGPPEGSFWPYRFMFYASLTFSKFSAYSPWIDFGCNFEFILAPILVLGS